MRIAGINFLIFSQKKAIKTPLHGMVLCDAAVLLRGRRGRDNTGRGELIAVETASFVHSDRFNRDSA